MSDPRVFKVAVYDGEVRRINASLARAGDDSWALAWNGATSLVTLAGESAAIDWLIELLASRGLLTSSDAVGHRVVHGGRIYATPVWITPPVLETLTSLVPLAPDHLPGALRAIRAVVDRAPALPQAACFDTAFHHTSQTSPGYSASLTRSPAPASFDMAFTDSRASSSLANSHDWARSDPARSSPTWATAPA